MSDTASASAWQPRDNHAHTTHSDGALTTAQLVARAESLGVRPGVADHCSRDVARAVSSPEAVRAYLDDLERWPGLARGGEFCWHDDLWRELPAETVRRMTHRVGSLHAAQLGDGSWVHMFQRRLPSGLTPERYMEWHVASLERMMAEMPVDVFAHPTLMPLPWRGIPLEELWTEAHEERAAEALARAGVAFEVSNRYRPHERLVRRVVARGVRPSLGSDGHTLAQVADLAWPLALARQLGVPDAELYDPMVHGSRTR